MKRLLAVGVLALCLLTGQMARAESRKAELKAEIIENYFLWRDAYKLRDADRIISFESPDFTHVTKNGEVISKTDADIACRGKLEKIQTVHDARIEIKRLFIEPHRVVVLNTHYLDADVRGPDDKLHRVSTTVQSRDIWVEYDRVWMLKRTEHWGGKVTIDGEPQT